MATITIRQLDDDVYEALKRDAKAAGRSLEAEARMRLGQQKTSRRDWAERLREVAIDPGPDYEGSVAAIRAIRDEE
jgi:plasmid stability protein